jgi:hypothetical protein
MRFGLARPQAQNLLLEVGHLNIRSMGCGTKNAPAARAIAPWTKHDEYLNNY